MMYSLQTVAMTKNTIVMGNMQVTAVTEKDGGKEKEATGKSKL